MFRIIAGDGCADAVVFRLCFVLLLPLVVSANAWACPIPNKTIPLTVSGHSLTVEVADNRASHLCGLAFRKSLPIDRGMLFVYPQDRIVTFWMKNTLIPQCQ